MGFVLSCPAADVTVSRPLPGLTRIHSACTLSTPSRPSPSAARYHACCLFRPRGFSPPRRFAPRDGAGCFATRAGQSSLRCQDPRPPPPGEPDPVAERAAPKHDTEDPFPAARAPSEEPPRQQAVMHLCTPVAFLKLPHSWCGPESPSPLLSLLQGLAPLTLLDRAPSPLPVGNPARVLPWASVPAALPRPKPLPPAGL
jgi:hypothetical protein